MMDMLRSGLAWALVALMCGCGSNSNVTVYPVRGTVTFEGQPMQGGGSIAFIPAQGQVGKGAGGIIAEDGTYVLGTYTEKDGSMPGEFHVVIMQSVYDEPENLGDGVAPSKATGEKVKPEDRIPDTYGQVNATDLKVTVEAQKDNVIDLDLKRAVPQWGA